MIRLERRWQLKLNLRLTSDRQELALIFLKDVSTHKPQCVGFACRAFSPVLRKAQPVGSRVPWCGRTIRYELA